MAAIPTRPPPAPSRRGDPVLAAPADKRTACAKPTWWSPDGYVLVPDVPLKD